MENLQDEMEKLREDISESNLNTETKKLLNKLLQFSFNSYLILRKDQRKIDSITQANAVYR